MISKGARARWGVVALILMMLISAPCFGHTAQVGRGQPQRAGANTPKSNEPSALKVRIEDQDVVAEIRNVPLQDVLQEFAAWTGIVFEIESQENPPVSVTFFRVPISEAIQRLTGKNNAILYYGKDSNDQNQIRFVRIFARVARPQAPSLRYIGTGEITKHSDDIIDSPEQAIQILAGSDNLTARQLAVEVLIKNKGPLAIQALKFALTDPAIEIKVAAIEGLATLAVHDSLPQILPALKDANPGVRKCAVQAVGLLGDSSNAKDLRPLLRDQDGSVAAAAEIAIQKLSVR